jgi:hypothetical protein
MILRRAGGRIEQRAADIVDALRGRLSEPRTHGGRINRPGVVRLDHVPSRLVDDHDRRRRCGASHPSPRHTPFNNIGAMRLREFSVVDTELRSLCDGARARLAIAKKCAAARVPKHA